MVRTPPPRRPPRKPAASVHEQRTVAKQAAPKKKAPVTAKARPRGDRRRPAPAPRKQRADVGPATRVRAATDRRDLSRWRWPRRLHALLRLFLRAPGFLQFGIVVLLLMLLAPPLNWLYQVVRKPTELFFPVSGRLFKTPSETWDAYGSLFRAHSTPIMTPELLAALAQSEASGNPVARTYWRWQATLDPFEVYRPASSAVGMYQFTDGTFDEARRWCIRDHRVIADGPWHDLKSCWFNALYSRVIPSHAVELAASNLDRRVREILARRGIRQATLKQRQDLAIVTHLCGAGAASRFVAAGLRVVPGQRCGDHPLAHYLARVHGYAETFARLARGS